jgi:hypothetical protein
VSLECGGCGVCPVALWAHRYAPCPGLFRGDAGLGVGDPEMTGDVRDKAWAQWALDCGFLFLSRSLAWWPKYSVSKVKVLVVRVHE